MLGERSKIYQDSANRLGSLQRAQGMAGNADNAAKAEAAKLKAQDSIGKAGVGQVKADAAARNAARQKVDADAIKQRDSAFRREMQDIKRESEKRIAAIKATERAEVRAAQDAAAKTAAARRGHLARQREMGSAAGLYSGVESRARAAGATGIADTARGRSGDSQVAAARDMERFAAATRKSGHALDFHTSSLLKNSLTVARWGAAVAVVQTLTRAFRAGVAGAVAVDRQFATLRAVFRGTDEEAQKLKVSTLDLAAAQGRSASEAMDASVRWSRLGMNRVQVLQATKVSLMAANVAEISAAEAAEKLSAIYATYRLNVGDLPVVLSRLNAISNRYNVTNKDLLEGIVRVAGVAKQAGLELRDLEGIIGAVTGATGRPGQEIGNALKFVVTRLAAPETMNALKKNFDIDLTGPNGDLKDMSHIFRELASLYPTLNRSQQALFLKLTAGSRQASRMALVMDQYIQSQILAAEAGFDTASAFEENQKILESLQSRIESLKTSWVDLFTTLGDAGAFDRVGATMKYLRFLVDEFSGSIDEATVKSREFAVSNPILSETIERFGGGENLMFGTRDDFSRKEIEETIRKFEDAASFQEGSNPLKFAERYVDGSFDVGSGGLLNLDTKKFKDVGELREFIAELKELLAGGGDNAAADEIGRMTDEVNKLRERLGSLERGANVFDMMAESIGNGTDERDSLIRNFEGAAHLLLQMEDGATRYGDAIDRFYKLIEAGDKDGLKKLMEELGDIFKGDVSITGEGLAEKVGPVLDQLRAKLVAIEKERREAVATPSDGTAQGERDRVSTIERLNGDAKAAQAATEQLTQKVEEFNKTAFNPKQVSNINKYLDDLLAQAAAWGSAYKDFAPDAGNDPVERIFDRARREGQLARGLLQDVSDVTNADSAAARGPAIAKKTEALAEMDRLRAQEEELEKQIAEAKADRDYWKNRKIRRGMTKLKTPNCLPR